MIGLSMTPGCVHVIGFYFLPESPRWLLGRNRMEEARRALSWIRRNSDVDSELMDINKALQEDEKDSGKSQSNKYSNALCLLHIIWLANEL